MNQKALKTLEYHKIISQLTEYAGSAPGKLLCKNLMPATDYEAIVQAQTETTDAVSRIRLKGSLSFSGVRDIRDSLKRLEIGSALSILELLSVSSLLTAAARARAYGRHEESEEFPDDSLDGMFRALEPLTPVNTEIKRCILSEDEVSDDASPGLRQVRRSMRGINDRIHTQLNSILNSSRTYLQDAVITMRDGRYCLPVKSEYKSQVNGMVHDQSATGSTLFIEPMAVIQLNNELRTLEIQEQKEIEAVLASLSNELAPYTEVLALDLELLTQLDFIFAKAALSRHYKCSQPHFNTQGRIHIKDGRHPLLDPQKVVPITLWLGNDFDQLIVTGPNTGGKTVSLKTVGLFTLMGQAGLHIPAFDGSEPVSYTHLDVYKRQIHHNHIRIYLMLLILFRKYLFCLSHKEAYIIHAVQSGIGAGILNGLRHNFHAIDLFCLLGQKQRNRSDSTVQIPNSFLSRQLCIFQSCTVQFFCLHRIYLVKRQRRDSVFHISNIVRNVSWPKKIHDPAAHNYICLLSVDTDRNACYSRSVSKQPSQPLYKHVRFCQGFHLSVQHQAHHQLSSPKSLPN